MGVSVTVTFSVSLSPLPSSAVAVTVAFPGFSARMRPVRASAETISLLPDVHANATGVAFSGMNVYSA